MSRSMNLSAALGVTLASVAAIAVPVTYVVAQDAAAANIDPSAAPASMNGTLKAFNLSPRGEADALLVDVGDGKVTQVNFPPHAADQVAKAASIGATLTFTATPRQTRGGATVYELVSLTGKDGKAIEIAAPGTEAKTHVEGAVASLNYGREGEVNGAILADGTFVHVGPREAEELKLAVGQKLVVDGIEKPTPSGRKVIDAKNVNGTEIDRPAPGPKGERGAPGPKGEKRAPGPKGDRR